MEGIGIYWSIIEMLYEQNGYIPLENIEAIAFALRTQSERIEDVINSPGLFKVKNKNFYSESVLRRLNKRNLKSDKARASALSRWKSEDNDDANAMRSECDSNAIKESKVKESKRKEKEKKNFPDSSFFSEAELENSKPEEGTIEPDPPEKVKEIEDFKKMLMDNY